MFRAEMPPAARLIALARRCARWCSRSRRRRAPRRRRRRAAPVCTPATLDASAQLDGAVTVSPMPGAADASPQTQISFLGVPRGALSDVIGDRLAAAARTPGRSSPTRRATAAASCRRRRSGPARRSPSARTLTLAAAPLSRCSFTSPSPSPTRSRTPRNRRIRSLRPHSAAVVRLATRPAPPIVTVHAHSTRRRPRRRRCSRPTAPAGQAGPMILDPSGQAGLVPPAPRAAGRNQPPRAAARRRPGADLVAGHVTIARLRPRRRRVVAGKNYRTIAEVKAGNGLPGRPARVPDHARGHGADHRLRPDPLRPRRPTAGARTARSPTRCSRRSTSRPDSSMFEWTSLDHVRAERVLLARRRGSTQWPFDFFHLNSINLDPDGTLLVSSRNTWAADDIDPGDRPGALDARRQALELRRRPRRADRLPARCPPGRPRHSTRCSTTAPRRRSTRSRVASCSTSIPAPTASRVRSQFLHPGHRLLADSQGDMQALPDGDWFVGWGAQPDFSEFSATRRAAVRRQPALRLRVLPCAALPLECDPGDPAGARRQRHAGRPRRRLRELERGDRAWRGGSSWREARGAAWCASERRARAPASRPRSRSDRAAAGAFVEVRALGASGAVLATLGDGRPGRQRR